MSATRLSQSQFAEHRALVSVPVEGYGLYKGCRSQFDKGWRLFGGGFRERKPASISFTNQFHESVSRISFTNQFLEPSILSISFTNILPRGRHDHKAHAPHAQPVPVSRRSCLSSNTHFSMNLCPETPVGQSQFDKGLTV